MATLTVTCTGTSGYELVLKGPSGVDDLAISKNAPLVVELDPGEYTLWRTMIGAHKKKWKVKLTGAIYLHKSKPPKNEDSRAFSKRGFYSGPRIIKVG